MSAPDAPTGAGPIHAETLDDVVSRSSVVLCCGTGGVGKTTTAAALAIRAAWSGRRVVVVTIDPARRLADALGVRGHGDDVVPLDLPAVPGPTAADTGEPLAGEVWITMLDAKATFDRLIRSHAVSAEAADGILSNRYYRNLSTGLSGTHEFMAVERLYELHGDDRFDLVVVDTPPSRNALDVFDAPDRLQRFLDGRIFRLATATGPLARTLGAPLLLVLRRVARVISPEVVDDTLAFIEAFSGMEEGFRLRAAAVDRMLADEATATVLVAAPTAEAVDETRRFVDRLAEGGRAVSALVINRLHRAVAPPEPDALPPDLPAEGALADTLSVLEDLAAQSLAEHAEIEPLLDSCPTGVVVRIAELDHDVADLHGIVTIASQLG